jgi:hypothetical protein
VRSHAGACDVAAANCRLCAPASGIDGPVASRRRTPTGSPDQPDAAQLCRVAHDGLAGHTVVAATGTESLVNASGAPQARCNRAGAVPTTGLGSALDAQAEPASVIAARQFVQDAQQRRHRAAGNTGVAVRAGGQRLAQRGTLR